MIVYAILIYWVYYNKYKTNKVPWFWFIMVVKITERKRNSSKKLINSKEVSVKNSQNYFCSISFRGYSSENSRVKYFLCGKESTDNSHCSIHSTESVVFSTTLVWNFSLPRPIVTKGSLEPCFPLIFKPLALLTKFSEVQLQLMTFSVQKYQISYLILEHE